MLKPASIEQMNTDGWNWALARGKEQFGNLEINLRFLEKANIFKPADIIHELGCGIGTIVHHLQTQGYQVSGSDIAANAVEYGKNKFPGINLTVHSAEELPYQDASFDVVLSFDVLEHLFEVDRHFREIYRVLKEDGFYVFQTPNKYLNVLYETIRHRSLRWRLYHPSLHTPGHLKKRLLRHGFSVRFFKLNPATRYFSEKLGLFSFLASIVSMLPFQYLPLCLQTNLYVVAQKQKTHENPDAQL